MNPRADFKRLVLGDGGGGRPDYLQKLKVPEGYEKMIDYTALSKPNFANTYVLMLQHFLRSARFAPNEIKNTSFGNRFDKKLNNIFQREPTICQMFANLGQHVNVCQLFDSPYNYT